MDVDTLKKLLHSSWCLETAYGGTWNRCIPTLNQCAVTALVVQDYLGGRILKRKMTNDQYHYLNLLPNDTELDLTADQFDWIKPQPMPDQTFSCGRSQLTRHKGLVIRYELLKSHVERNRIRQNIPAT